MKELRIEIKTRNVGGRNERWWYACRDAQGIQWIEKEWDNLGSGSGTERIELNDAPSELRELAEAALANASD